jgi:hypothetical protein
MAFPAPLPFSAFGADALISATFRYLPLPLHAFTYGQVLFAWVVVLLTAVVLIADPRPSRGIGVLTISVLAVPLIAWRMGELPYIVFVLFHANPNSAIARPIGLAFAFHVYRAFSRKAAPSWPFLVFVPVASLFFKPNMAFAFGFLQLVGFAAWFWSPHSHGIARGVAAAASVWILAIMLTFVGAVWAVSPALHPSVENLWQYADIAIPALEHQRSFSRLLGIFTSYLAITGGVTACAVLLRSRWAPMESIARTLLREAAAPAIVLAVGVVYLLAGWWFVAPLSINGEPMHVNFDLIVTLMTPPIAIAVCRVYDRDTLLPGWSHVHRVVTVAIGCALGAFWVWMAWRLTTQTAAHGGLPLHFDYDIALEDKLRHVLHPRIPDGHCFSYGRRFAVYVDGGFEPDFAIAATGCPVLNGERWRGRLGENDPDALAHLSTIAVSSGPPFRVVDVAPCTDPPGATSRLTAAASGSTVQLAWMPAAGAALYVIEVGSAPGRSDIGPLTTYAATSFTASDVRTGTYYARVRARNLCGVGAASNEITVRVQ